MDRELEGVTEAYRPPATDDDDALALPTRGASEPGYVISTNKLLILYLATIGLYELYWFFRHWKHQQLKMRGRIRPIGRAIFSIFYVTQLFKAIDADARSQGPAPSWNPGSNAAVFIGLSVTSWLVSRLGNGGALALLAGVIGLAAVFPLLSAQQIANSSYGDASGSSNSKLSAGNIVIVLLGAVLWLLAFASLATARAH